MTKDEVSRAEPSMVVRIVKTSAWASSQGENGLVDWWIDDVVEEKKEEGLREREQGKKETSRRESPTFGAANRWEKEKVIKKTVERRVAKGRECLERKGEMDKWKACVVIGMRAKVRLTKRKLRSSFK